MSQPPGPQPATPLDDTASSRVIAMAIYICYLASFLAGITAFVGVVLAYMNEGTGPAWLDTHYRYQIRTFWIGMLYTFVGFVTILVLIGWIVLLATSIWLILRCARGLTWLDKRQPVPDPATWGI
jgi:uncharacterized membrane protein